MRSDVRGRAARPRSDAPAVVGFGYRIVSGTNETQIPTSTSSRHRGARDVIDARKAGSGRVGMAQEYPSTCRVTYLLGLGGVVGLGLLDGLGDDTAANHASGVRATGAGTAEGRGGAGRGGRDGERGGHGGHVREGVVKVCYGDTWTSRASSSASKTAARGAADALNLPFRRRSRTGRDD